MLKNISFEGIGSPGEWTRNTHTGVEYGEIYVPAGWVAWWEEGDYGRPEMKVIRKQPPFLDPPRIHGGDWAVQIFTYCRRQHAGLYQIVEGLMPGVEYELSAFAHAWSTKPGLTGADDAHCSAGVGCGPVYIPEGEAPPLNGDPENDAIGNFAFSVGVSFGEPDPFGDVQWGDGVHSYNAHHEVPSLCFVAPASGKAVVYLRAHSLWDFRTSDAYWDDVQLEAAMYSCRYSPETPLAGERITIEGLSHELVLADLEVWHESGNPVAVEPRGGSVAPTGWFIYEWLTEPVEWKGRYTMVFTHEDEILLEADFHIPDGIPAPEPPPECWGEPRVQYRRTYVLLPPDADAEWAHAVIDARWDSDRWTLGGSADDSGLGALDYRRVIAVNPDLWPDVLTQAWFDEYYPGVDFVTINADTPEQLKTLLELPNAHE